jgi:hypothetical protein
LKEVRAVTVFDNAAVTKFARRIGVDWSITREVWEETNYA